LLKQHSHLEHGSAIYPSQGNRKIVAMGHPSASIAQSTIWQIARPGFFYVGFGIRKSNE
jgi:hypothetical protein